MHELAVTESILEIALRHAQNAAADKITGLHIVVGQFSSIVDDSVQFYWDMISQGTIAEGARLDFRRIPAELLCLDCDHHYNPGRDDFACPKCRSTRVKIVAGEEFFLESMDVEKIESSENESMIQGNQAFKDARAFRAAQKDEPLSS